MGLSRDVLNKLLVPESIAQSIPGGTLKNTRSLSETSTNDGQEVLEFEYESPTTSPETLLHNASKSQPAEATIDPVLDDEDDLSVAESSQTDAQHKTFRLRLLSESKAQCPVQPMGVMDMVKTRTAQRRRSSQYSDSEGKVVHKRGRKHVRKAVFNESGGVKAEYVLVGESSSGRSTEKHN